MKSFMQLVAGLFSALGMVIIVFSALLLSISEDPSFATAMSTRRPADSTAASPTSAGSPVTPPPGITLVVGFPSSTPAPTQSGATLCPTPAGWQPYTVEAGDQLDTLAAQAGVSAQEVMNANCLISASLMPGTLLYLPYSPTQAPSFTPPPTLPTVGIASATPTRRPACGPPRGWVLYSVQPNDTLYKLSVAFSVSVYQLQQANCLSGTLIQAGTRIYVPNVATRTPEVEDTAIPEPSSTPTPVVPSATSSVTPTPTDTAPTDTSVPPSETPTETATATETETATETATETPTITPTPTTSETSVPVPPGSSTVTISAPIAP